jgi:hypothetical protein
MLPTEAGKKRPRSRGQKQGNSRQCRIWPRRALLAKLLNHQNLGILSATTDSATAIVGLLMIFGIFNAKPPPLTAFCTKLSVPANLFRLADGMTTGTSSNIHNRAVVLSLVMMAAAGNFVEGLRWDRQKGMWEGSRRYLRDTNSDVIAAEAIVWIQFLMGKLWKADQKNDPETFERVGYDTINSCVRRGPPFPNFFAEKAVECESGCYPRAHG